MFVTLAFNELMRWVYLHSGSVGGGASGLELPDARLFGFDLRQPTTRNMW